MRKSVFFLSILLTCSFAISAQTIITGDIGGQIFKPSGNPWVVKENLYIENGEKTTIKQGCIFLFKPFTGIVVQGSLEVEGHPDAPVVFTSINDTDYNDVSTQNAEPFDWNGISIEKNAETVKMSNFVFSYSVYGLKSKKEIVILERGVFKQNGQFHFTINDKIQEVESNLPFSYNIMEKTKKNAKNLSVRWAKPLGTGTLIIGTAFLGVMSYFIYLGSELNEKYDNAGNPDDATKYSVQRDKTIKNALFAGSIGGLLVPVGAGFLIWENRNSDKELAFYPFAGKSIGFELVMTF